MDGPGLMGTEPQLELTAETPPPRALWDHQVEALENLRLSVAQGVFRIVLQAPTGSGKTRLSAEIVAGAQRKKNRLAFVVSSISLIDQTIESFYSEGIRDIGVIQADHSMKDWSKPVQVCSIQTIRSKGKWPEAQVVIIDECHELHAMHKKWLDDPAWKKVPFIGLSATPWTKGLSKYFHSLLVAATTQELIDKGILSKFKVFATGHPDLKDVKIVRGDYDEVQLSDAMQKGELTADIVKTWQSKWGKDKTFIFAVDCAHAQAIQARFQEAGIKCAYQDAHTTSSERAEIRRAFHSGDIQAVASVGTLTTGVDWDVRCIVYARPTRSEMLFVQAIGRGLRTAPGKDHCLILDHSDTTQRLGFVTDIHHDTLRGGKDASNGERKKALPKPCPKCDCMLPRIAGVCSNCGFQMVKPISGLIEHDGELVELSVDGYAQQVLKREKREYYTMRDKVIFLGGLKQVGLERGYKPGWAMNQYREKFNVWPDWSIQDCSPLPPTMEVRQWVRSRQIAYAKSKRAAGYV